MKCYRCEYEVDWNGKEPCRVDLGHNLAVYICSSCMEIVLRDAMTELFVSRIKERMN